MCTCGCILWEDTAQRFLLSVSFLISWIFLTSNIFLPPPRRLCFCWTLFVCLSVCLSVCEQDNSKSYGWIFLKFWGNVGHGINYKWFNFGGDPAGILDSGSLWNLRYHCVKGGIREQLAKWIWWRHLANNIALTEVPVGYDCFLRVKAECFARLCHGLGICPSVRPSVRPSHSWSVSKRCKLGSQIHCELPQGL